MSTPGRPTRKQLTQPLRRFCSRLAICSILFLLASGCGSPPPAPGLHWGISLLSTNTTHLILDVLPLKDYPALKKFQKLREVQFWNRDATDEKLEALAAVDLPCLTCVSLNGSPRITDRGIEVLSRIPSLHEFGLEDASITDAAVDLIIARMKPTGVNVAYCTNITFNAMLKLIRIDTMTGIGISSENLTTSDVLRLLDAVKNIEYFGLSGPSLHLDTNAICRAARGKMTVQGKTFYLSLHTYQPTWFHREVPAK
jgi:hypothetical protein